MKTLLVAINSKYIHSNLAVQCIKDYCSEFDVTVLETNINTPCTAVVDSILLHRPDIIGFSTYIFNISFIQNVIADLRLLTNAKIVFGGPEAGGNPERYLPLCDHVIIGEGEIAWRTFLSSPNNQPQIILGSALPENEWYSPSADYLNSCKDKLVYYETSRGCPYSCTYCMSGGSKYRKKDFNAVKKDIDFICGKDVKQVKLVDRTFNADIARAKEIFRYIIQKNPKTCFHAEMAPDLFDSELFEILGSAREGLFQFEIGIQTFSAETLKLINRKMNVDNARRNIEKIISLGNIHTHVDLIFGLPGENATIIKQNVNSAVSLNAHCLQLGFLKVLSSSALKGQCEEYGIVHSPNPPFEILYSSSLSHDELIRLKNLERVFDYFYNQKKFTATLELLQKSFDTAYDMYDCLGEFLARSIGLCAPLGLNGKVKLLHDFAHSLFNDGKLLPLLSADKASTAIENCLRFDYLKLCSDPALKSPLCPVYPKKGDRNIQSFTFHPITKEEKSVNIRFDYSKKSLLTEEYGYTIIST